MSVLSAVVCEVCTCACFFFFKQKTAYEMRISDWSSDVCSSDLWIKPVPQFLIPLETARSQNHAMARLDLVLAAEFRGFDPGNTEIGRASWRERVCQYV